MQNSLGNPGNVRWLLGFTWALFAGFLALSFHMQQRGGRISFLLAHPTTKPHLFCTHYLVHILFLLILIVLSLLSHYLDLKFTQSNRGILDLLFDPRLLFSLTISIFIFILAFFALTSGLILGRAAVGAFMIFLLLIFGVFLKMRNLAERLLSLNPLDSPSSFLILTTAAATLLASFILWTISFDEIRDKRNRRWLFPAIAASVAAAVLAVPAAWVVVDALNPPLGRGVIEEIMVEDNPRYPVVGIISDHNKKTIFFLENRSPASSKMTPQQMHFRIPKPRIEDSNFFCLVSFKHYLQPVIYRSSLPVWGQDIRAFDLAGKVRIVSAKNYARIESLSAPFLSTDGDRIAYLKTSRPRFGKDISRSVCITAIRAPITESIALSDEPDIEYSPIGWTHTGQYFLFQKNMADDFEVWAVDWLATELFALPNSVAKGAATADNFEDIQNQEELRQLPEKVKDVALSYWNFAYRPEEKWLEKELNLPLLQVKRAPFIGTYAIVAKSTPESAPKLGTYSSSTGELRWILDNFQQTENQWDWYGSIIIYAQGKELWQVNISGERTLITTIKEIGK
jgi:hypothetical protein